MAGGHHILAIITLATCNAVFSAEDFVSHEHTLMKLLLKDYDTAVRPVQNYSETINVILDMTLMHILQLDEQAQTIELNTWLTQTWYDFQLKWEPQDHGKVDSLRIPRDRIWTPDIVLLNNAAMSFDYVVDNLVHVRSDGLVTWVPHARLLAFCSISMRQFPFDTQSCQAAFGSWTYTLDKLNITTIGGKASLQYYQSDHSEWSIIHYEVQRHEYMYSRPDSADHPEIYPYIVYNMGMKRSSHFYAAALISPIVMLVILTNFLFFVPPHSNERLTLAIGIIISLSVLTVVFDDYLPTHVDDLPVIFMYMLFDFVMTTIAILISIMVYNFHHREYKKGKLPSAVRRIFLGFLRKVLCMKAEPYNSLPSDAPYIDADTRYDLPAAQEMDTATPLPKSPTMALEKILDDIRKYLKQLSQQQQQQQQPVMPSHRQLVVSEWHQLALVLDRLAFIVYVILTILVSLSVLRH